MSNKEKSLEYALRVDAGFLHLVDKAREIEAYLNEDVYGNRHENFGDEQYVNEIFSSTRGNKLNDLTDFLLNGHRLTRLNWPDAMVLKVINGDLVIHVSSLNSTDCTTSIIKIHDLIANDWVVVGIDRSSIGKSIGKGSARLS